MKQRAFPENRILRDILDCINLREETTSESMRNIRAYVTQNEQQIWDNLIGPAIDQIVTLGDEAGRD